MPLPRSFVQFALSSDPDADVEGHFGWENKLNYDSEGYRDEEEW